MGETTHTSVGNAKVGHASSELSGAPDTDTVGSLGARMGLNRSFDDQQQEPTPSTISSTQMTNFADA